MLNTVPGGVYKTRDGRYQDADGHTISEARLIELGVITPEFLTVAEAMETIQHVRETLPPEPEVAPALDLDPEPEVDEPPSPDLEPEPDPESILEPEPAPVVEPESVEPSPAPQPEPVVEPEPEPAPKQSRKKGK
jgi:hypothetical protein